MNVDIIGKGCRRFHSGERQKQMAFQLSLLFNATFRVDSSISLRLVPLVETGQLIRPAIFPPIKHFHCHRLLVMSIVPVGVSPNDVVFHLFPSRDLQGAKYKCLNALLLIVIVKSRLLKRHPKVQHRAPAHSNSLVVHRIVN